MLLEAALSAAISIYCIIIMAACARWAVAFVRKNPQ
jgi:hypothetical protein